MTSNGVGTAKLVRYACQCARMLGLLRKPYTCELIYDIHSHSAGVAQLGSHVECISLNISKCPEDCSKLRILGKGYASKFVTPPYRAPAANVSVELDFDLSKLGRQIFVRAAHRYSWWKVRTMAKAAVNDACDDLAHVETANVGGDESDVARRGHRRNPLARRWCGRARPAGRRPRSGSRCWWCRRTAGRPSG